MRALEIVGNKLLEVDLATGDRKRISNAKDVGGPGAVVVDLTTGDHTTWPCWHPAPLIPAYLSYGVMIIEPLPPHDLRFAHDLFSVVKCEVKTRSSHILSL